MDTGMPAVGGGGQLGIVVENQILNILKDKECELDAALEQQQQQRMQQHESNVDDDDLEAIRARRMQVLANRAKQREDGHGSYTEIFDEKDFFEIAKKTKFVILVFFRPSFKECEDLESMWKCFAAKHASIRCICINAEKAPYLTEKLRIWCLPTMVLVKNKKTEHSIIGLDELGGKCSLVELEKLLESHGFNDD